MKGLMKMKRGFAALLSFGKKEAKKLIYLLFNKS